MSPLPFDHAIVRFACLLPKGEKTPRLVFASVEMLPRGRAVPDETPLDAKGYPPGLPTKSGRLSFRRVALSAQAALDWYLRLGTLPEETGPHVGRALAHASLLNEPAWSDDLWPALVVPIPPSMFPGPMEDDRIDPFTGANREAVRVHRRLTVGDPAVDALHNLSDAHQSEAFEWLRLRTWVDFKLYPELLGSAALVVPDPELRALRARLNRDDEGSEAVVFEPNWRAHPVDALQLVLRERRHGGLAMTQTFDLAGGDLVRVPRPQPVDEIGWEVIHSDRGVVAAKPMTGFIRTIGLNTGISGRTVSIEGKDGRVRTSPSSTRTVQEVSRDSDTQVGTLLIPVGRLAEGAEARRSIRATTSELWLNEPTHARDVIHKILTQARTSIMLVDPFADGLDLAQYGASSSGAAIRMLTAEKSAGDAETIAIQKSMADLNELGRSVEVRRMPEATLHDRFLVVDDAVWLLGASLNGLGNKATMLVRLQSPRPVREHLEQFWAAAKPIEAGE